MKRRAAARECHVDVGFWGGVIPGNRLISNRSRPPACWASSVFSVRQVSTNSPMSARRTSRRSCPCWLRSACRSLCTPNGRSAARTGGRHAAMRRGSRAGRRLPSSRPSIALCAWPPTMGRGFTWSTSHRLRRSRRSTAARARGVAITVETCPHYLTFATESIRDGATTFKCAPPIRTAEDREGLWQGLIDGRIDLVASDHSPRLRR